MLVKCVVAKGTNGSRVNGMKIISNRIRILIFLMASRVHKKVLLDKWPSSRRIPTAHREWDEDSGGFAVDAKGKNIVKVFHFIINNMKCSIT